MLNSKQSIEMPDIANESKTKVAGCLDRVGMTSVELPIQVQEGGKLLRFSALADAFVSLDDPSAKGIHMSRLYLAMVKNFEEGELSFERLRRTAEDFVSSHKGLSKKAFLKVNFEYLTRRAALLSDHQGWRSYPVWMQVELGEDLEPVYRMGLTVTYSSTCPCSAALARQLIQEKFNGDFSERDALSKKEISQWLLKEESICATPHSQRSYADVTVELDNEAESFPSVIELIDKVEKTVETVVQAAVKREDEQEFARLNGKNLMFCEDAGRKLSSALEQDERLSWFRVEAKHVESLHPHNAVSIVEKRLKS